MGVEHIYRLLKTKKQKGFVFDFSQNADQYEKWEEVEIGKEFESQRKFEVTLEDIVAYTKGVTDDNPLMNDPKYAGKIVEHPLFCVQVAFWCIGTGSCSWIRTPGAINPGQKIEIFKPFEVGDMITLKQKAHDKWIKRDKRYLTYGLYYYNQKNELCAIWWLTLILPKSGIQEKHQL